MTAFLTRRIVRVVIRDTIVNENHICIGRERRCETAVMRMPVRPFCVSRTIPGCREDSILQADAAYVATVAASFGTAVEGGPPFRV